jgi:hypothetical protein
MATSNSPVTSGPQNKLQLHDIHVPEQISNFPVAPGWWILLAALILIGLWSYKKYNKNKSLNADKKQALAILASTDGLNAKECIALLKWTAMKYFSRQQLAKLYGKGFQDFLIKQLPPKHQDKFSQLISDGFVSQYQEVNKSTSKVDADCQLATELWLNYALPVKKSLAISNKSELTND